MPSIPRRSLVVALPSLAGAALLPSAHASVPPPRLLLARDAPPAIDPAGFLVSEKLDGVRGCWDGHTLRFRSGRTVAAPGWFLAALPPVALDGELWLGRGRFDAVSAATRRERPDDSEWRAIRYEVFEAPDAAGDFATRHAALVALAGTGRYPVLQAVAQEALPNRAALQRRLDEIVAAGGEGLMLHRADAPYVTGRSDLLLKLKPLRQAEATVTAHVAGRGRHAGRLGALEVRAPDGRRFRIGTGFSDAERDAPPPVGSTVGYSYRELTASGLPRFASYGGRRP